jgi:hypothetical protein
MDARGKGKLQLTPRLVTLGIGSEFYGRKLVNSKKSTTVMNDSSKCLFRNPRVFRNPAGEARVG